ncbi:RNA-binding protein [Hazenella coriacea]|uniref:RNA-binding protein YlmH n=1 Tax=Hazenella coriacea TaxID=1179467 RepID=A0A4R3L4C2_9BACL|nr:YlmH/Sll1252 family protein [Hazenella coriacea]TCS94611.1 RNA-binding protein YlmH [Hazenella coriacea]
MKPLDSTIMAHFRQEERPFVERCSDWIERSMTRYQPIVTPFLDPREQHILETLIRRQIEVVFFKNGGFPTAERSRVVLGPDYLNEEPELFQLSFLRMETTSGKMLEHPDVLGSLLGLGLKREKIGDILPHDQGCDVVIVGELSEFIRMHLTQVGKEHVTLREISHEDLLIFQPVMTLRTVTVVSLRVDALISEGFRLSRTKATALIKSGKCKVNWKVVEQPSFTIQEGDMISIRGYGRLQLKTLDRITKKGRKMVEIASYR